jgi:hypothetical protein
MNRGVKFFVIGLIFLLPLTTYARTVQVLMAGNIAVITSNSAARFNSLFSMINASWATTGSTVGGAGREIVTAPGVLQNFTVRATFPLGAGSYTATVMRNAVATSITCTITSPATTCSDTTNSTRIAVGDELDVRYLGSGSPNLITFTTAIDFVPDVSNETLLAAEFNENQTVFAYSSLYTRAVFAPGEATATQSIMIPSGVFSNMRAAINLAPGAGTSMLFSLRSNQATTSLACTISDTAKTCSDTTHFASTPAGTLLDISVSPTGAAAASGVMGFGMKFVPTTLGQFFFMGGSGSANQGTATTYLQFSGISPTNGTTTQSDAQMVANAMTITGFSVAQTNVAGVAAITRTYTLEVNGSATAATCSVAASARSCSWQGSVTVNQGDLLDYIDTVTGGAATNAQVRISTVATRIQPPTQHSLMGGFLKIIGGFIRIQ